MERDLSWYLNEAKKINNIPSDRKLAIALDVSSVALWRNPYRAVIPTAPVMVRLAKMANVPEEIALIDRDIFDAKYTAPETIPFYQKIKDQLKKLPQYAAMLTILIAFMINFSDIDGGNSGLMIGEYSVASLEAGAVSSVMRHTIYPAYILCE